MSAYADEVARMRRQAGAELSGIKPMVPGVPGVPGIDWIGAASTVAGAVLKPAGAGPSRSDAQSGGTNDFDSSGWVIDFGSGSASSSRGIDPMWVVIAAGIGLLAWTILKK